MTTDQIELYNDMINVMRGRIGDGSRDARQEDDVGSDTLAGSRPVRIDVGPRDARVRESNATEDDGVRQRFEEAKLRKEQEEEEKDEEEKKE